MVRFPKVFELKLKVGQDQGYENAKDCRLIFAGNVLRDEMSLADVKFTRDGFVVVMPPKKPVLQKPSGTSEPSAQLTPAPASSTGSASELASSSPPSAPPARAPSTNAASTNLAGGVNSLVMGSEYESMVSKICEMGFEDQIVRKALRAAFNNPDRAVEFLFNGIPEVEDVVPAPPAPSARVTPPSQRPRPSPSTGNPPPEPIIPPTGPINPPTGAINPPTRPNNTPFNMFASEPVNRDHFDALRRQPRFNLARRAIQANPQLLPSLLEQLALTHPNLLSQIDANQGEFERLIHEPLTAEEEAAVEAELVASSAGFGGMNLPDNSGRTVIQLNDREQQQIERLENLVGPMGLSRNAVLEAWLACERNEELAANYLLNNLEDFLQEAEEDPDSTGRH